MSRRAESRLVTTDVERACVAAPGFFNAPFVLSLLVFELVGDAVEKVGSLRSCTIIFLYYISIALLIV